MDEDLSIINTRTRNQKIKDFLVNNKNKIAIFLILIIIILISFFGFKEYKYSKRKHISDKYHSTIIDYSNGKTETIKERLREIIKEEDPTYSPLSLYFIIDNDLAENSKEVNDLFDVLINKTSLDDEIKNLILYKKGLFNANESNESELLEILNPLIRSNSIWKSHALYLIAEFFYDKNENQKAKEFFEKITLLENSNADILKKTQIRLNRDLSD